MGVKNTDIYSSFYSTSEYLALSHSVRALLPLKSLIKEVIDNLGIDGEIFEVCIKLQYL